MIQEEKIEIPMRSGAPSMGAFLAQPSKSRGLTGQAREGGKVKAVLLVQEAYGVNHHMREMCRRVVDLGFVAIAPEFFHRSGKGLEFGYDTGFAQIMPVFSQLTNAGIREDLEATYAYLKERFHISTEQVAVMGYCMGGFATMLAATSAPIALAISYYGAGMVEAREGMGISPLIRDFKKIQCPVLLFFGGDDAHIPQTEVKAIESELKAHGKKFECTVFPGAGHAFSNDDRPSYHAESTQKAWDQVVKWLKAV